MIKGRAVQSSQVQSHDGTIKVKDLSAENYLEELLARITPENCHQEIITGVVGAEEC